MATQVEEAVSDSHLLTMQEVSPEAAENLFDRGPRRHEHPLVQFVPTRYRSLGSQSAAVDLAMRRERQLVEL
ncbi:MAG TPA: hypothetical protein VE078_16045, partial [Thermoanaerobaculia bacterium]|nr:hypothetical protein [Thermoanaerobaculia bacterium]